MISITSFPWFRRWFGNRSERAAAKFLESKGYRILARNYTCRFGEIDLVALDGSTIVFVEVRSTQASTGDRPAESVGIGKQRRITRVAHAYLQSRKLTDRSARFDVVTVAWPADRKLPTIEHIPNAFEAVD